MKLRLVSVLVMSAILAVLLSGCEWWKTGDNRIDVVNHTRCRLYITVEGEREAVLEPGDVHTIRYLDDGRYELAAYRKGYFAELCATWESKRLDGEEKDTWIIDNPECDQCDSPEGRWDGYWRGNVYLDGNAEAESEIEFDVTSGEVVGWALVWCRADLAVEPDVQLEFTGSINEEGVFTLECTSSNRALDSCEIKGKVDQGVAQGLGQSAAAEDERERLSEGVTEDSPGRSAGCRSLFGRNGPTGRGFSGANEGIVQRGGEGWRCLHGEGRRKRTP